MTRRPISESRRYDFPPLLLVPLLLLGAIGVIWYVGLAFGVLGVIAAVYLIVQLERKADAYVRGRDTGE